MGYFYLTSSYLANSVTAQWVGATHEERKHTIRPFHYHKISVNIIIKNWYGHTIM